MNSLLQTQIHDKLRRGIGYNATPPPYNNNYIPPTSDLLETKDRNDLPEGATEIDPLDEVVVEDKSDKEVDKSKENKVSGEIPLENNIITNEDCGRAWIKSKNIEKTEGKSGKVHYKQTTVVNPDPCKQCACKKTDPQKHDKKRGNQRNWNNQWAQKQGVDLSKINRPKPRFICGKLNHLAKYCCFNPINQRMNFQRPMQKPLGYRKFEKNHVPKKSVKSKSHMKKKSVKESVNMWVPKSTKNVSTATTNSAADNDSSARSNTTANNVSTTDIVSTSSKVNTANSVSAANKVSTAQPVSTANSVSASKVSTTSSVCAAKPIILTKYSNKECSEFKNPSKRNGNQQLQGKSIWNVDSGCSRHMTGNMSCLKNFKKIDGEHVDFGNTPDGDSECIILAPGFKVVDEKMILLRCWELKKSLSMVNAASSELLLLEVFKVNTAEYYYC
ncbi:hypothetical protein L6452_40797 [Arctium lappa]|uniref:Uncharacterized protein n=1 Tax=Arctium lappa TaxID=4217 RepID=A0ACB8XPL5_ARCLA|nr:hypothetical protein L6452_40797 [Arctium lappa]